MEANARDEGVLTTYATVTPSPTPSKEVHSQTSIRSTPTTLVGSTIRYNSPQKAGAKTADACTTEGEMTCAEDGAWYICGLG